MSSYSCSHLDWQKMDLPTYPRVVKKPMDLSTIRKKLDGGEYDNQQEFYDDFKLMIRNCFAFNPSGTPVNLAGQELQRLFDEKWKGMPQARVYESEEEDDGYDSEEDDRQRTYSFCPVQKLIFMLGSTFQAKLLCMRVKRLRFRAKLMLSRPNRLRRRRRRKRKRKRRLHQPRKLLLSSPRLHPRRSRRRMSLMTTS